MVEDTPDARFMTDDSSTTLPLRLRVSSGCVSLLERGMDIDEFEEWFDPLTDCLNPLRMDFRTFPFSGCAGTGGADAGKGGVIAGATPGEGVREIGG